MKTKDKNKAKQKKNNENKSNIPPPTTRTTETTAKDFIYRAKNCFSKAHLEHLSLWW